MQDIRIIVVGAGIGGLAAALGLQRRGFKVTVYERAPEIREVGAGLIVTANARRALDDLGVDQALFAASSCVPVMYTCNYATGEIGAELHNADVAAKYGYATLQVHRADLHALLMEAVHANDPEALRPGHACETLSEDAEGVTVRFENGHEDRADVVIGADGNASRIRSHLFPGVATTFNGQIAFRALLPAELVPARAMELGQVMLPGPDKYLLYYPLRGGSIMNVIGCGRATQWEDEGWAIPATNAEFAEAYSDFVPYALDMIRAIPEGALFKWGLRDREPLATWTTGRVAMLGDAAHPMTPFLGQGACLAIEDAMVLSRAFAASGSVGEALKRYEAARRDWGNGVQMQSQEEGRALQDPSIPRRPAIARGLLDYDPVTVAV